MPSTSQGVAIAAGLLRYVVLRLVAASPLCMHSKALKQLGLQACMILATGKA